MPIYACLLLAVSPIVLLYGLHLIAMSVKPVAFFGVTGPGNEHMRVYGDEAVAKWRQ